MPQSIQCAFFQFDITPNVSHENPAYLQGMAGGLRAATSVAIPLSIELCMLEDSHATKLLVVTADIIGFDRSIVNEIRTHAAQWGIDPEGIILNASHTHYAPGTLSNMPEVMGPYYENYAQQIQKIIVANLQKLYQRLEPCQIYSGRAVSRVGVNRRYHKDGKVCFAPHPEGAYISNTPLVMIELKSSGKKILWVNHGCHPTGMGADTRIAADYPGILKYDLRRNRIADGIMFFQGAGGSCKEAVQTNGQWKFCDHVSEVRQNGARLAGAVKDKVVKGLQPVEGPFFCKTVSAALPLKPEGATVAHGEKKPSLPVEIQMVCLGNDVTILAFPMEPAAELAQTLYDIEGISTNDFLLGYTNGLYGYLPTDSMLAAGGYESEQSHHVYQQAGALTAGTESRVVETVTTLLSEKKRTDAANGYGRYHQATGQKKAFFVLSSGRCGTMTLAHLLDIATNARIWHHPEPFLVTETLDAYLGRSDKGDIFWRGRGPFIHKSWAHGLIHGETDHNMTPFTEKIAEEIPDSKFVVLVRNPRDFVRSGMRRNYYQGHPWDVGRLRPESDNSEHENWATMDQFEKVCWLWNETYSRILEMTRSLPEHRVHLVKFEDLVSDPSVTEALFKFLELDGYDEAKVNQILGKKLNAQRSGKFPKLQDWDAGLKSKAEKQFGMLRKQFGYASGDKTCGVEKKETMKTLPARPKLLFLEHKYQSTGGHLDHIVEALKASYDVKYLKTVNMTEAQTAVNWADIVWLEWANQIAIHATNDLPQIKQKKVVCRLHGFEVFTDMPTKINWENVHRLMFVANHKKEIFNAKVKDIPSQQLVIRNGVDVDKFTIAENKTNTKKLVLLGHLNFRKGLPVLLHFYQQLVKRDPSYFLYIRGEFQDEILRLTAHTMIKEMGLDDKIEFVGWVKDLNEWFADKSHILSFSLEESFHYAIGNGMAAGLKPIIHAWTESRDIWPNEFIFKDLDEFIRLVEDPEYDPGRYRQMLADHHLDAGAQMVRIQQMLGGLIDDKSVNISGQVGPPSKDRIERDTTNFRPRTGLENNKESAIRKMQAHWLRVSPYSIKELEATIPELLRTGRIKTMKCERLRQNGPLWEVEFGVENEQAAVFVQFLVFDQESRCIYLPFEASLNIKKDLSILARECIASPHIKLNESNRGMVFDQNLLKDIKKKFDEYIWERMYPGTVFTPLGNFLTHMGRYDFVRQFVDESDIIVDAACGIGYGAKYLSQKCSKVCAIDLSENCLDLGKRYYSDDKIQWLKEDVTSLPLADDSVDCYVSMETFEHLPAPVQLIKEMRRVVKKDGVGFISTPNGQSPRRKMINNPYHVKEYSHEELRNICGRYFKNINFYGMSSGKIMVEIENNFERFDNLLIKVK